MSTTSGYRLRKKDAQFRAAWDDALTDARRGLIAVAHERAVVGKETVIIRKGVEVERRISPDSSMLALLIKQGKMGTLDTAKFITLEEWDNGIRFDRDGAKISEAPGEIRAKIDAKLDQMRDKFIARKQQQYEGGERTINIKTGEGVTAEVVAAVKVLRLAQYGPRLLEDKS